MEDAWKSLRESKRDAVDTEAGIEARVRYGAVRG